MKQETKELVDWIKKQINIAKINNIAPAWNGQHKAYNDDYDRAVAFLDSLPKIEAHLCRGGYIQDRNGIPCCDGDKIKFEFCEEDFKEHWSNRYPRIEYGELKFETDSKGFVILFGKGDWIDWNGVFSGPEWFEKV